MTQDIGPTTAPARARLIRWIYVLAALVLCGVAAAWPSIWVWSAAVALLVTLAATHYVDRIIPCMGMDFASIKTERDAVGFHARTRFAWVPGYLGADTLPAESLHFHPPGATIEGRVRLPELGLERRFRYGIDKSGFRRTSADARQDSNQHALVIYGASATFGLGLDDDQTFPWHLQRVYPQRRVFNYGVEGFSLYEMYLLMRHTLPRHPRPAQAIVALHPNSIGRDTACFPTHYWIRGPRCLSVPLPWRREPGLLHLPPARLATFAARTRLRPVKVAISLLLSLPIWPLNWRFLAKRTAQDVLLRMRALCEAQGVEMFVYHLGGWNEWTAFLDHHGFRWASADFSSTDPDAHGRYPFNLFPFDPTLHPNGEANRRYARGIADLLDGSRDTPLRGPVQRRRRREPQENNKFVYPLF